MTSSNDVKPSETTNKVSFHNSNITKDVILKSVKACGTQADKSNGFKREDWNSINGVGKSLEGYDATTIRQISTMHNTWSPIMSREEITTPSSKYAAKRISHVEKGIEHPYDQFSWTNGISDGSILARYCNGDKAIDDYLAIGNNPYQLDKPYAVGHFQTRVNKATTFYNLIISELEPKTGTDIDKRKEAFSKFKEQWKNMSFDEKLELAKRYNPKVDIMDNEITALQLQFINQTMDTQKGKETTDFHNNFKLGADSNNNRTPPITWKGKEHLRKYIPEATLKRSVSIIQERKDLQVAKLEEELAKAKSS